MGVKAELFSFAVHFLDSTQYSMILSLCYIAIDWYLKLLEDKIGDRGKMKNANI